MAFEKAKAQTIGFVTRNSSGVPTVATNLAVQVSTDQGAFAAADNSPDQTPGNGGAGIELSIAEMNGDVVLVRWTGDNIQADMLCIVTESGYTATRAGRLDKLNVTGTLAHSDISGTFKADVSGLATALALATVDSVVDAIKVVTDNLPNSGALTDLATAAGLAVVDAIVDKLDSAMELDGSVYRFTENALEQAPGAGGGGTFNVTAALVRARAAATVADQSWFWVREDTTDFSVTLVNSDGTAFVLAGTETITCIVRRSDTKAVLHTYSCTISDAANGVIYLDRSTAADWDDIPDQAAIDLEAEIRVVHASGKEQRLPDDSVIALSVRDSFN